MRTSKKSRKAIARPVLCRCGREVVAGRMNEGEDFLVCIFCRMSPHFCKCEPRSKEPTK